MVHYYSNNKLCLSFTRRVESSGVRLPGCATNKKNSNPNGVSAASNTNKYGRVKCFASSFSFLTSQTHVPVHLRLVSSLFEALRSLQSKFSSQNSANHTFLRLFSRVSAVKYSSNPGNRGKRRMAQFRNNYQPIQTWRK